MNPADVAQARVWADIYWEKGFNVLPSRPDAKRPFCSYADYWDKPLPYGLFGRYPTTNLQVMTGRHWRLLVIDLDGPAARDWWATQSRCPRTWATHSGGDGLHLWFRLPADYPRPLPKGDLWRPDPSKPRVKGEAAVERLCDLSLVMAPPSIHHRTGRRYRFRSKGESPLGRGLPADCPGWILDMPLLTAPPVVRPVMIPAPLPAPRPHFSGPRRHYLAADVRDAIPDVIGLAASWGVRFSGRETAKGWCPCHAIDREDRHPSAAVHRESGTYTDRCTCATLSLFGLAAALGHYSDWKEALADLGDRYHARSLETAS